MLIFLDIDGVLNSTAWCAARPVRGFIPPSRAQEALDEERIDPACVARLRALIERTGARLVITSSWRHQMSCAEFLRLLELYGSPEAPVVGVTPDLPGPRGGEVRAWLDAHAPHTAYAVLDDDRDFLEDQVLVQIDADVGLTDENVEDCVRALGQQVSQR
jgi:hypothetical protein